MEEEKFLYHLINLKWDLIDSSIREISNSIDALAKSNEKPWWHNWLSILSIFLAAFLAYVSNSYLANRKEKKEKSSQEKAEIKAQAKEINTAIMALRTDFITVISFKKQRVTPYLQDIERINSVSNQDIETIFKTLSNTPELFKFFSTHIFNQESYADNLNFISLYRPPYLMTLQQVRGSLSAINYIIKERNDFIRRHMEASVYQQGVSIRQHNVAIQMLTSYGEGLKFHVDSALWFIELSKEHLIDYAAKNLPDQKIQTWDIEKQYKDFMPEEDEHFSSYRKMLENFFIKESGATKP